MDICFHWFGEFLAGGSWVGLYSPGKSSSCNTTLLFPTYLDSPGNCLPFFRISIFCIFNLFTMGLVHRRSRFLLTCERVAFDPTVASSEIVDPHGRQGYSKEFGWTLGLALFINPSSWFLDTCRIVLFPCWKAALYNQGCGSDVHWLEHWVWTAGLYSCFINTAHIHVLTLAA